MMTTAKWAKTRNHVITEAAAVVMGHGGEIATWHWIEDGVCAGFYTHNGPIATAVFAPLTVPAHAYELEHKLRLNVQYVKTPTGAYDIAVTSDLIGAGAVRHAQPGQVTPTLKERMFAVTQFAALMVDVEVGDG